MRVLCDLRSHLATPTPAPKIVQVEKTPALGDKVAINGRFAVPVIKGVEFPINKDSYILDTTGDVDGGDVSSISYAYLLAQFASNFGNVYFNPLLTSSNVDELDFTAAFRDTFSDPPNVILRSPRLQTGRGSALPQPGQMPTHTALLAMNTSFDPTHPTAATVDGNRPGLLITKEIDIGSHTVDVHGNQVGADEFMLYWKLYDFEHTHDIAHGTVNQPCTRSLKEADQEPEGFTAYVSPDNGITWCHAGLLESVAFCNKTKKIRIAFMNTSSRKRFLATFGVMF